MNIHIINDAGERTLNQPSITTMTLLESFERLFQPDCAAVIILNTNNKSEALKSLEEIKSYIEKDL